MNRREPRAVSTTISSREFNQDTGRAKKAALKGPVFITDRGKPAHVLLSVEDYRRLTACTEDVVDRLSMPDADEIEFEPEPIRGPLHRPVDFD